jgi:hypothetical protein
MNNFNNVDNYLEHVGKKGMKWGKRTFGTKGNKPTEAQQKNRKKAKVVGGVAILAGTAAAGVVLGRRGRIKISDANKLASAKSAKLVNEVGSFFVKNNVDKLVLAANVRDIAEGIY